MISVDYYSDEKPPRLCISGIDRQRVDQLRRMLVENRDNSGPGAAAFWCSIIDQLEDQLDQVKALRKRRIRAAFDCLTLAPIPLSNEDLVAGISQAIREPVTFEEIEHLIVNDFKSEMAQL